MGVLADLNERKMTAPLVQAMFERSRHHSIIIFIISQEYYKPLKRKIGANGNICHIFKPNSYRHVQFFFKIKFQ